MNWKFHICMLCIGMLLYWYLKAVLPANLLHTYYQCSVKHEVAWRVCRYTQLNSVLLNNNLYYVFECNIHDEGRNSAAQNSYISHNNLLKEGFQLLYNIYSNILGPTNLGPKNGSQNAFEVEIRFGPTQPKIGSGLFRGLDGPKQLRPTCTSY